MNTLKAAAVVTTLALASYPAAAQQRCTMSDPWQGPDKTKHFIAGAGVGAAVTLATERPHWGFAAGVAVGAAKELVDRRGSGTCSFQDFAVTALGAAAGAYGTAWLILPDPKGGVFVGYSRAF